MRLGFLVPLSLSAKGKVPISEVLPMSLVDGSVRFPLKIMASTCTSMSSSTEDSHMLNCLSQPLLLIQYLRKSH